MSGSADVSLLQLTVQSLWKMNQNLRTKLMSKQVSEFPVEPPQRDLSMKQNQLSNSVHALQKDVTSLMAMPKVVDITQQITVPPEQGWRQANAQIYKAQHR